jgi:hypothetical protein
VSDETAGDHREVYHEFESEHGTVAIISDPENDRAWIQSDVTRPIRESARTDGRP